MSFSRWWDAKAASTLDPFKLVLNQRSTTAHPLVDGYNTIYPGTEDGIY